MTRIGACCLITIGVWVVIELAVQFGHYRHQCKGGTGTQPGAFLSNATNAFPCNPSLI